MGSGVNQEPRLTTGQERFQQPSQPPRQAAQVQIPTPPTPAPQVGDVGFRGRPQTPQIPQQPGSPTQPSHPSPTSDAPSASPISGGTRPIFSTPQEEEQMAQAMPAGVVGGNGEGQSYGPQWSEQDGYQTTGSSWDFTAGNYNIAGGNRHGYEPGARGKAYGALKGYSQLGPQVGVGKFKFGLLPYQGVAGAAADAIAPDSPFQYGDSESGADWSGGATGGDLYTNKHGTKVSGGYGYGQVDPSIARHAGYTSGQGGSEDNTPQPASSTGVVDRHGNAVTDSSGQQVGLGRQQEESDSGGGGGGGK